MPAPDFRFPPDFIWAIASSAYQVEDPRGGGRGDCVWDEMRRRGLVNGTDDLSYGCMSDHPENVKADIANLEFLGVSHYRLSIAWTRILPTGLVEGEWRIGTWFGDGINEQGVAFYRGFLEQLKAAGIEPIVTLYHADYPLSLYTRGGWLVRDSVRWFVDYARVCFDKFGDLVSTWLSINELEMQAWAGCVVLEGQPRQSLDREEMRAACGESSGWRQVPYIAIHHQLLAHAETYHIYKKEFARHNGRLGLVIGGRWCESVNDREENRQAAENANDFFRTVLDPILGEDNDYPRTLRARLDRLGEAEGAVILPTFTDEEKARLKGALDFIGLNYYRTNRVRARTSADDSGGPTVFSDYGYARAPCNYPQICGDSSWLVLTPHGLEDVLAHIRVRYGNPPVLVTENGCCDFKWRGEAEQRGVRARLALPDPDRDLGDWHRVRYLQMHIAACANALSAGSRLLGYTAWCLADNFEWDDGFCTRFGLFRVDYDDPKRERTPKMSALFYKNCIAGRGMVREECWTTRSRTAYK